MSYTTGMSRLIFVIVLTACLAVLAGCGKSQQESTAPPPSSPGTTAKLPAVGPAISAKLTFDQLALESPVKRVKTKNGLVFLHFEYADNDGNVYKCELPEAMSKGEYTPEEWIRIFNLYKRPQVIAQKKKPSRQGSRAISDFPFISPRPQTVETSPSKPATSQSPQLPTLPPPPMPSPTQPQPVNPRAVPSAQPRQFMPEPGT